MSSATTNALWGMFNLVVACVLVARLGRFDRRQTRHAVAIGLGAILTVLMLAHAFGKFHGDNL
jgi:VIT1/CCC1 family predicted Fe2+/Mn2+ transporter